MILLGGQAIIGGVKEKLARSIPAEPRIPAAVPAAAFLATAFILTMARLKAPFALLLADRLVPGAGWAEIALLAGYAAWLAGRLAAARDTSKLRLRIWLLFSIVFFTQFIVGVAGVGRLLMTGRLHVPVPAMVIAGPIYRGEGLFMPLLFLAAVALVGPAWCSHLCYIGAWDGLSASRRRPAGPLSPGWTRLRVALFLATPLTAWLLRTTGAGPVAAALAAVGFGVAGAGVMAFLSRRRGVMVHCTAVCPLGLAGNLLGRISPFRLRIGSACSECGRCIPACRYSALDRRRLRARRIGLTCTLCGDCLGSCREGALAYRFPFLSPRGARLLFLVLAASLHATFLGVARI